MIGRPPRPRADADRPPVLAHRRFAAARDRFEGLDLAARFRRIEADNLWGADTSVSGLGSEFAATAAVRAALPRLLAELSVRSLLDAPCGDARWIAGLPLAIDYVGVDIVPALVEREAACGPPAIGSRRFLVADITADPLPAADLILCRDCLVHLSFANIARALANFRASGATWLLATTFPAWNRNLDCEDGDWRALNLQHAPFGWPAPERLIDEHCDEGGGGWDDKSLGLWRLADLPG
jgi:SAM-dependent methyltransferase